jgi:hypothetical protein
MLLRQVRDAKLQIGGHLNAAPTVRSALTRLHASDTLFSSRVL